MKPASKTACLNSGRAPIQVSVSSRFAACRSGAGHRAFGNENDPIRFCSRASVRKTSAWPRRSLTSVALRPVTSRGNGSSPRLSSRLSSCRARWAVLVSDTKAPEEWSKRGDRMTSAMPTSANTPAVGSNVVRQSMRSWLLTVRVREVSLVRDNPS